MIEIPTISAPFAILLWPLKWVRNFFRYIRKIKFPKKKKYSIQDDGIIVNIGDLPENLARYEIHIFSDKTLLHNHIQQFNFGIGISIPKGGTATIDLNTYLRKCFLDCKFDIKPQYFHVQVLIYVAGGMKISSPKYSYSQ